MLTRRTARVHGTLLAFTIVMLIFSSTLSAVAAPYAALVMDARSGKVLHSQNADTRLHPASLTKMMTLYIAFQAIESGQISLDTIVTISQKAASEPPSKLGLRAGQKIKLRYLVRGAAVKSANDAATAIGEAIAGSEAAFARRMNATAKSLGMTRTTFKNAHGLTENGHLSTARDMSILGRHVLYDYPEYYNLFSRRSANAGIKTVPNTNRRLLNAYRGADGIKTGYTRAAGFNLVASAERGRERIIATVFGGRSTASRNARVAELLDLGFKRAPSRVAFKKPRKPAPVAGRRPPTAKVIHVAKMSDSPRPRLRPAQPAPTAIVERSGIENAIAAAQATEVPSPSAIVQAPATVPAKASDAQPEPKTMVKAEPSPVPLARPQNLVLVKASAAPTPEPSREVVTRVSTSGGRHWGVNVGRFGSQFAAEKALLKIALTETGTLDGSLRKVIRRKAGFDANFMGLNREAADLACRRLQARQITCFMIGPNG